MVEPSEKQDLLHVVATFFGGSMKTSTGAMIILVWMSINWCASAVYDLLQWRLHWALLTGMLLPVLFVRLRYVMRDATVWQLLHTEQETSQFWRQVAEEGGYKKPEMPILPPLPEVTPEEIRRGGANRHLEDNGRRDCGYGRFD